MIKSLIIVLIIVSMLLEGCSSYSIVTEQDKSKNRPAENEPINFVLSDGSEIESKTYHHIYVVQSDDFVYGIGEQFNRKTGLHNPFQGKLMRPLIDSSTTEWVDREQYLVCWLSDSSYVRFSESDYVVITPDQGAGFWCVGTLRSQNSRAQFKGKVSTEKIQELQIRKFSATKTVILILGIAAPPGFFLILLAAGLSRR